MNANITITANDVLKYLCKILNIDMNDKLFMIDMLDDLQSIEDLALFRVFVKERFSYERFRYLTGDQKFIKLVQEYKKENTPKLNEKQIGLVDTFSQKLFSKTCDVFDEVNVEIQNGKSLLHFNMEKSFDEKEMQVLNKIGTKKELRNLATHGKVKLENDIQKTVHQLTLVKNYPQLAIESKDKFEARSLLESLGDKHE